MGYYINSINSNFRIRKDRLDQFFEIITDLMSPETIAMHNKHGIYGNGKDGYSWVDTNAVMEAVKNRDIFGVFEAWRFNLEPAHPDDAEFISLALSTYREWQKTGDEEVLYIAIAPVVEDGSFMEMQGEDSNRWCLSWDNGKLFYSDAMEIRYKDPIERSIENIYLD